MRKKYFLALVCLIFCMASFADRDSDSRAGTSGSSQPPLHPGPSVLMNQPQNSNPQPPANGNPNLNNQVPNSALQAPVISGPDPNNQPPDVSSVNTSSPDYNPPPPSSVESSSNFQAPERSSNISSSAVSDSKFIGDERGSYLTSSGVNFLERMKSCSPAKYAATNEAIYGKTKNGKCHYSYKRLIGDEYTVYHCMLPMRVSLAYASTALDAREYSVNYPVLAEERAAQNLEIRKVMQDYCVAK